MADEFSVNSGNPVGGILSLITGTNNQSGEDLQKEYEKTKRASIYAQNTTGNGLLNEIKTPTPASGMPGVTTSSVPSTNIFSQIGSQIDDNGSGGGQLALKGIGKLVGQEQLGGVLNSNNPATAIGKTIDAYKVMQKDGFGAGLKNLFGIGKTTAAAGTTGAAAAGTSSATTAATTAKATAAATTAAKTTFAQKIASIIAAL